MTDASNWLPLTPLERRNLALDCIAKLYKDRMDGENRINVYDLLIETSDAIWSESTATGDAMFLPGQFRTCFPEARKPEGNIYFAGEHLSYHHTWISGAADSALYAVRDMLNQPELPPLEDVTARNTLLQGPMTEPIRAHFEFTPSTPIFPGEHSNSSYGWPLIGGELLNNEHKFPTDLGMIETVLGAKNASLKSLDPANCGI